MLVDEVYDAVLALLMDGEIPPGARANIESIARDLGVSPTPVREALARLESEGLVVKQALKGYTAAQALDTRGVEDVFQMRMLLEPAAARLAAGNISREALAELRGQLGGMMADTEADQSADYRDVAFKAGDLHRVLAESSGNTLLTDAVVRLRAHLHDYRLHFERSAALDTGTEHAAILDALEKRDAAGAEAAMRAHLEASRARIEAHLRRV